MSHEVETMDYANEVPWHGLGQPVHDSMTPQEMLVAAQLDWTVSKRPAYTVDKANLWNIVDPTGEANFMPVEKNFFVTRDSDNTILGHCGENYTPFQNAEVMQFFDKFCKAGNMKMETAGSLKHGKDIWGLAKMVNNSHAPGKAMQIMFSPIRVVCNNTLTMALAGQGQRFRVLHLQMFDEQIIQAAEEAMGLSSERLDEFQQASKFLASRPAKWTQVEDYIGQMFQPQTMIERAKAGNINLLPPLRDEFKRTASKVLEAIECSPGSNLKSAKGTWWGVLNGVTYVMDHDLRSQEKGNALHSSWFGSAANTKRKALAKALEFAA